jgi:hypothetical protein
VELGFHLGMTESLVACRSCGATAWLRMLDCGGPGGTRHGIYAVAGVATELVDSYLERGGRPSCDLGKAGREVEALLSNAGRVRLLVALERESGQVLAVAPVAQGERLPVSTWPAGTPASDDDQWFRRLELDKAEPG